MTPPRACSKNSALHSSEVARLGSEGSLCEEGDYLSLTETTNRLVELRDGVVEIPTMPTPAHQQVVSFLVQSLQTYLATNPVGMFLFAPLRVRLWKRTFREPDIVFMSEKHATRMGEDFWDRADLVMEVVSGSAEDRRRDLVTKRREYAKAGIDEYWIVDPKEKLITVLKRKGTRYMLHGRAKTGQRVGSALLRGFEVEASEVFASGAR